ncbi:hypothetical protein ANN_00691 [Periplaneta americana]|uniref:Mos1 transposase HTH domain-containing protein n=1 Tax=Periplaneta americana TaxID=6978 RepID=A0ABQ8TRH2_PERAM|nr:hypothetical protein ANN_00691 [Periplaneta americana]
MMNLFLSVVFYDEATFHLSGKVNRHNLKIWESEIPRTYVKFDYRLDVCRVTKEDTLNMFKCERPKTILTKLEQRSWIKIEMARGHTAQECFQGLREACGDAAFPYRTVARWVKAFREGIVAPVPKGRLKTRTTGTSTVVTRYDPCDYDLFTKVKEPLRGTRYNTRDELIRALGRSIRNINKDGRADDVRRLPNIWQKVAESKRGTKREREREGVNVCVCVRVCLSLAGGIDLLNDPLKTIEVIQNHWIGTRDGDGDQVTVIPMA